MSMIKVEDLTFSYPTSGDPVFEHASFSFDTDWRLGFVGRNGRGKTTLLRLLLGQYEYSGKITGAEPFVYFPYEVKDKSLFTLQVLTEACPQAEEWELVRELSFLDMDPEALQRPFETLSGGEQTKALLAALFLNEGHFPLIDEPTNHLDAKAREAVSNYLRKKKGFLLVSHDRRFLDGCTDHILSLNRSDIEVRSGNFSSWMENFTQRQESEAALNEKLKKDIGRLSEAARRTSAWSDRVEASKFGNGPVDRGFVGHKSAKMMKRAKAIEARRGEAVRQKEGLLKNTETAEDLKMNPLSYHADVLASFSEVSARYGAKEAFPPVSFDVRRGERVALDGKNGSGKSSLLKLLAGEPLEYGGTVFTGSGLKISYVPQDASVLAGSLYDFASESGLEESLFFAVLRKLDLSRAQFEKDMSEFSSGQKKKVLLARSLCEQAHLYVWDEPLNYVDLYSRMQIERLILEYSPTMVFVEHDGAFRDAVATRTVAPGL